MNGPAFLTRQPIAHRGYHDRDAGRIENSLSAFEAAAQQGFAIELDVQVSRDGVAMVFHDKELDRLTAETGRVDARTADELEMIGLTGGPDTILRLAKVLSKIDGRVPIVVEMKDNGDREKNKALAKSTAEALLGREDDLAAMSFSHDLVRNFHGFAAALPVGLTAEGTSEAALEAHRAIFDIPIRFVSYNVRHLPNAFVHHVRDELGLPVITWTVRDAETRSLTAAHADQMTFEGFNPHSL